MRKFLTALGYFFTLLTVVIVFSEQKGDSLHAPALFEWRTFKVAMLSMVLGAAFLAARNWLYPSQTQPSWYPSTEPRQFTPQSALRVIEPTEFVSSEQPSLQFYDWAMADGELLT